MLCHPCCFSLYIAFPLLGVVTTPLLSQKTMGGIVWYETIEGFSAQYVSKYKIILYSFSTLSRDPAYCCIG
jgi:hypothetical protein